MRSSPKRKPFDPMTLPPPLDPVQFKSTQRELWSSVAGGWRKWWPTFEAGAHTVNERLVDLARVETGMRVLDVCTGIGEPALTAARRVGQQGRVLGTDLSPEMIAFARERAREAHLANAEFREMDAEKLALEPASFDAVLSRWGIMLLMDPKAALHGIRRALKPGARVALAVWGPPETVPFIAISMQAPQRELGLPPPPPGTPGPFSMSKPGDLEALLAEAGFRDVSLEITNAPMEFDSAASYCEFARDMSASLRRALAEQPEEARARTWAAIEREASAHASAQGRIRFENRVHCATGCAR
jgi:SAM-dependent methyltransferase